MSPTSSARQLAGAGAGAGVARHAAAFKVHRDSHSIHKATSHSQLSSSSTNSSVSTTSSNAAASVIASCGGGHHRPAPALQPPLPQRQQQQQQPVIIYTHSPKVIRTNPRDFMSIVQKLTGLDGGRGDGGGVLRASESSSSSVVAAPQDESSSSSSESCANTHAAGPGPPHPYADSQLMPPPPPPPPSLVDAHFMAPDIVPLLFAPDAAASDLQQLCAPRGLYGGYGQFPPVDAAAAIGPVTMSTNTNSAATNGGAVFSPSMVETAVRTFPGYN